MKRAADSDYYIAWVAETEFALNFEDKRECIWSAYLVCLEAFPWEQRNTLESLCKKQRISVHV